MHVQIELCLKPSTSNPGMRELRCHYDNPHFGSESGYQYMLHPITVEAPLFTQTVLLRAFRRFVFSYG